MKITLDYNGWRKDIEVSPEVFHNGVVYFDFYKCDQPDLLYNPKAVAKPINYSLTTVKFYRTEETENGKYLFKSN